MALCKNHCVTCVTQPVTQRHTWIERSKERKVIHPQAGLPPASALSCGQATRNIRRRWRTPWTCTRACLGLSKGLPRVETFLKKSSFTFYVQKRLQGQGWWWGTHSWNSLAGTGRALNLRGTEPCGWIWHGCTRRNWLLLDSNRIGIGLKEQRVTHAWELKHGRTPTWIMRRIGHEGLGFMKLYTFSWAPAGPLTTCAQGTRPATLLSGPGHTQTFQTTSCHGRLAIHWFPEMHMLLASIWSL